MFNIRKFYEDYNIEYYEGEHSHAHCRPGWINTSCIRCTGNPGLHLGFSENSGQFVCWRCGFIPLIQGIKLFTGKPWHECKRIIEQYGGVKKYMRHVKEPKEKDIDVIFPKGTLKEFPETHKKYLEKRNFDPDELIDTWDLSATGMLGNYKFRIIAPIYYRNILMSYQGRDITDRAFAKYMACDTELEKRHHKHCLYGMDMVSSETVLVVEGITDVWRLGPGAIATFGIKYTEAQVLLLYHNFKRIFVMFDWMDSQAIKQAKKLVMQLNTLGKESYFIQLDKQCDPGDLSPDDAKYVMRDLLIT